MKMLRNRSAAGFSTMEFLIYVGLFGILLTIIGQIFVSSLDTQLEGESASYVQMDGQYVMSRLEYDLGRATSIVTPTTLGGSGSTLQVVIDGTTHTYSLSGSNLLLNGTRLNGFGSRVTALSFTRRGIALVGQNTITVSLTLESIITRPRGEHTQTFTSTYALR